MEIGGVLSWCGEEFVFLLRESLIILIILFTLRYAIILIIFILLSYYDYGVNP